MNNISKEQEILIRSFTGNRLKDDDFAAFFNELYMFLNNKSKHELIDPCVFG